MKRKKAESKMETARQAKDSQTEAPTTDNIKPANWTDELTLANEKLEKRNSELEQGPNHAGDMSHKKGDVDSKAQGLSNT